MGNKKTLDKILAERKIKRLRENMVDKADALEDIKKHQAALKRIELSKEIALNFTGFNELRNHFFHPSRHPHMPKLSADVEAALELMQRNGWIKKNDDGQWTLSVKIGGDDFNYLQGHWLEEYVYCAHLEAGVDEAFFNQHINWQVGVYEGVNEIDVIARRGDKLSFTSCKTRQPMPEKRSVESLSDFLEEVHYWDTHFAGDAGKLLLVVTADFIDEIKNNTHRYPQVAGRAMVLDVGLIGLEDLNWERLVAKINQHWN